MPSRLGGGVCFLSLLFILCNATFAQIKPLLVAADGSGQFTSIQSAIDAVPAGGAERYVIDIRPGTYRQRVRITKDKPPITLRGDEPARTLITWKLAAKDINPETGKQTGTDGTATVSVESNDFIAENLSFENSYGPGSQAVAVRVTGDRTIFRNCRFHGWQDTLYIKANGRHWLVDCLIEGAVDFIFGRSTALFENCEIRSLGKGYITAAGMEEPRAVGYVFDRCKLTAGDEVEPGTVYLGRPWRPFANVVYTNCEMGAHIRPEGWDNWRDPEKEKTAHFAEYNNTGPGADQSRRVPWSRQLSADEAAKFAPDKILAGDDNWNPRSHIENDGD